jgi:(+)-trans-carveol dehydrogenase
MSGRVEGKIAVITGAARGQGRSHAIRLAQEGADIIAVDACQDMSHVPYALGTADDLAETVRAVESLGRRIVAVQADVRDYDSLKAAVDTGVEQLGRLDIVCANAGITTFSSIEDFDVEAWRDVIDTNLTGVFQTAKASIPHLRASGGGSIIITSSVLALKASPNVGPYVSAKTGLTGLMRTLALELAGDNIRVNTVNPTGVNTPMVQNPAVYALFAPDLSIEERTPEVLDERFTTLNLLPIPLVESVDVSNAVLWLASDEARYVTGAVLPVDGGSAIL